MTEQEQQELEDLEVTVPPLAGNPDPSARQRPREDVQPVTNFPEDDANLEAFRRKYGSAQA